MIDEERKENVFSVQARKFILTLNLEMIYNLTCDISDCFLGQG